MTTFAMPDIGNLDEAAAGVALRAALVAAGIDPATIEVRAFPSSAHSIVTSTGSVDSLTFFGPVANGSPTAPALSAGRTWIAEDLVLYYDVVFASPVDGSSWVLTIDGQTSRTDPVDHTSTGASGGITMHLPPGVHTIAGGLLAPGGLVGAFSAQVTITATTLDAGWDDTDFLGDPGYPATVGANGSISSQNPAAGVVEETGVDVDVWGVSDPTGIWQVIGPPKMLDTTAALYGTAAPYRLYAEAPVLATIGPPNPEIHVGAAAARPDPTDPYGVDLYLDQASGDLVVSAQGGLVFTQGPANVVQALQLRVRTYPGELPCQPLYGSVLAQRLIGLKAGDTQLATVLANLEARRILDSDQRMAAVHDLAATSDPADPHKTRVAMTLELAGGETAVIGDLSTGRLDELNLDPGSDLDAFTVALDDDGLDDPFADDAREDLGDDPALDLLDD